MTDLSNLAQNVINIIRSTPEYEKYASALEEIKKDPDLYRRVNELRLKNFELQQEDNEDMMDLMDALTNEYEDVINLESVNRFMEAEAGLCRLFQEFNYLVTNGLEFD